MSAYRIRVWNNKGQYTDYQIEDENISGFVDLFKTFKNNTSFEIYRNDERDVYWEELIKNVINSKNKKQKD